MRNTLVSVAVAFLLLSSLEMALGNTDARNWKMASGETLHAELVKYDIDEKMATLRERGGEPFEQALEDFSVVDQAWLIEWAEFSDELEAVLDVMDGTFTHYQTDGEVVDDFYVYTPSQYSEGEPLPLLFLLHPSGKGARYVKRFMQAGEELGVIVVSCDGNRNGRHHEEGEKMFSDFEYLLGVVEDTVLHDPNRLYLGGTSGGGLRAFHYSAKIDRPWAGILSNGGWLGSHKYYDLPYPEGIRVAIVNGNSDAAANQYVEPDSEVLVARDCEVGVFSFEGGHQVPPPMIQIKVLEWLLGRTDEVYQQPVVAPITATE